MSSDDPYLFDDVPVLRNLLNIRDEDELQKAECDITYIKLLDIDKLAYRVRFDLKYLQKLHAYIFGDLYDWAGTLRTVPIVKGEEVLGGDTVRYDAPEDIARDVEEITAQLRRTPWKNASIDETAELFAHEIAALWQAHPFREGNTRTVITFATQFAAKHDFPMDKQLLKDSADYVRRALVKASDGKYSDYSYLEKIFTDAIVRG